MKKICRVLFFSVVLVFLLDLGWSVEAEKVKLLANQIHSMFRNLVLVQKVPVANALQQQRQVLLQNADVREAIEVPGHNLFVHFKDGNELLMFLGEDRLGSAVDQKAKQVVPQAQKQPQQAAQINPELLKMYYPCAPNSHKALIFDCLEDDANVVTPKIAQQVKMDLEALGYTVTSQLNNNANLANATLMDDGEYGVVFMRGHGGVFGDNYFVFQTRPWYDSYPPASSGYTGTLRASAYCQAQGKTMFSYVISGQFSNAYWQNKPFPSTLFFLESCHGTDPTGLAGMPTWTVNHGAAVWLGWNESVSFNCGDNGTKLAFQLLRNQKSVADVLTAVHATGCRPPDLTAHPADKSSCRLAAWRADPNEPAVPDQRDFKLLRLVSNSASLYADISFYAVPNFDEIFFYVDTGGTDAAEVLVRCRLNNFEVYKQSTPGLYNIKVYTGTPVKSGMKYSLTIPWNMAFGSVSVVKVWLYDMTGKDRLPDAGSVAVVK